MALLAGPKRKQKLGIDPNNTNWVNDSSAFGQSLLKKMGWKEGKGLGANEDGRTIPVKASLKIDNKGLGCTAKDADAWIAHREEFDEILAALNNESNTTNNDRSANSLDSKIDSPTDKKAEGQKRFYGRFSRGGVKTLRTTEDLDCIMGRRKPSTPAVDNGKKIKAKEDNSEEATDSDDEVTPDNCEVDKAHGFVTKTSSCSVQDYFAQKMKNKNIPSTSMLKGDDEVKEDMKSERQEEELCKETFTRSNCSVQEYFARKMKTKNEKLLAAANDGREESSCEKENAGDGEVTEANCEEDSRTTQKKKGGTKKSEVVLKASSTDNVELDTKSSLKEDKKERKKRKRARDQDSNDVEIDDNKTDVPEENRKRKKVETDCQSKKGDCESDISMKEDGGERSKQKKPKSNMISDNKTDVESLDISNKKGRKKKASGNESDAKNIVDDKTVILGNDSKKAKKKRKNENEESLVNDSVKEPVLLDESNGEKENVSCEETLSNRVTGENEEEKYVEKKKRKKKNKLLKEDAVNSIGGEMNQDVKLTASDDSPSQDAGVEETGNCNPVDNDESDLSQKTKNARKKMKYKIKKMIMKKLEEMKKDVEDKQWMGRMKSLQEKANKNASGDDCLRNLRVKLLDKALLEKKGDKSSKKQIKTLDKQIRKFKKTASEASESIINKAVLELETLETSVIKKVKRRTKKNISIINKMAAEEKTKSNLELNWKDEITSLENVKKRTISEIKTTREGITQELNKKTSEVTKAIEDLEKSVAAKMEQELSTEEPNSVFPGATTTQGYMCRK